MKLDGQLTIGTMKTYDDLGLVLLREMELCPPEPKICVVDIPGGNGVLDLTEAVGGDIAYENRKQAFEFDSFGDFEVAKTRVSGLLHGRVHDYRIPSDPDYTYHGRFTVESYEEARRGKGRIKLTVSADPYKYKTPITVRINAAGGARVLLESGRMPVCPTIEVSRESVVDYRGVSYRLMPGASRIRDLWLHQGINEISINTYPDYSIALWANIAGAWSDIRGKMLSEVAAGNKPLQEQMAWMAYTCDWAHFPQTTWQEATYPSDTANEKYQAYIQYEWGDL